MKDESSELREALSRRAEFIVDSAWVIGRGNEKMDRQPSSVS